MNERDAMWPAMNGKARREILSPPARPEPQGSLAPWQRLGWKRAALALAIAAISDGLAWIVDFVPPAQWALDLVTAALLFVILGRRWGILPGLVAEAIPGFGVFPFWLLVVLSILLYDDIRGRHTARP